MEQEKVPALMFHMQDGYRGTELGDWTVAETRNGPRAPDTYLTSSFLKLIHATESCWTLLPRLYVVILSLV